MTKAVSHYFPLNYFQTIISPIRSFTNRKYLSVLQQIIVIIFLQALLMMPLSLQLAQVNEVDSTIYFPTVIETIDQEMVTGLQDAYESNEATVIRESDDVYISYLGSSDLDLETVTQPLVFSLGEDYIYIREPDSITFEQSIDSNRLIQQENVDTFISELSRQFTSANRLSIYLTGVINITALVLLNVLGLILGTSFILSFMKKLDQFDIHGFKDAFQVVLNTMGLPTLIAALIGFISSDTALVFTLQGLGFVLMLMISYWKTHFNDAYAERQRIKKNRKDEKEVF